MDRKMQNKVEIIYFLTVQKKKILNSAKKRGPKAILSTRTCGFTPSSRNTLLYIGAINRLSVDI